MTHYVALLRGVNVGGNRKAAMADLREFFSALGYADVQTLLQSGNVVFGATGNAAALEHKLGAEARRRLGLATDFHVRSARDWSAVVAGNPFPDQARRDPGHLVVQVLKGERTAAQVRALREAITGRAIVDAKLGTRGTGRNWNTVTRVAAAI